MSTTLLVVGNQARAATTVPPRYAAAVTASASQRDARHSARAIPSGQMDGPDA